MRPSLEPQSKRWKRCGRRRNRGTLGTSVIEIRALTQHADFNAAVRLQQEIWGFEEIELLPVRLFVVATKIGGQAFGAYSGDRMVGFCLAIPGLKPGGRYYLHSHMLGVRPEFRNAGVGRLLKLKQREEAQSRDIALIEWTFDPLEIKNAYFNMERLGAIVRRYVLNQYGTTSSHLHGGLPTDRCIAEWWLKNRRVDAMVNERPFERGPIEARIVVPADIASVREHDSKRAREIQLRISEEFGKAFDRGLAVVGFERSPEAGTYLFGKWESN
ncbi:MAG: GNAT family N-acetyltransferase [Acidobacteriaceae bacterium]|nr:GNAT family N-acetyltransferase [Acidobacteriaceae bacterium]